MLPARELFEPSQVLVGAAWLRARLDHPLIRVVDVRSVACSFVLGAACLARHASVGDLRWTEDMLEIARAMSLCGVSDHHAVVFYDEGRALSGAFLLAERLRRLGHPASYVLGGGFPAWQRSAGPCSSSPEVFKPEAFTVRPRFAPAAATPAIGNGRA
jgi:3-mercaptopyruvate sulfurtransferase SseA